MAVTVNVFQIADAIRPSYLVAVSSKYKPEILFRDFQSLIMCSSAYGIKFLKYSGDVVNISLPLVSMAQASAVRAKVIRGRYEFASYIKELYVDVMVNPISKGIITVDSPCVYINNNFLCNWRSYFESDITDSNFVLDSNGAVFRYEYTQPIFILREETKRHVAVENKELFLINMLSGVTTRSLKFATDDAYVERDFVLRNGIWSTVNSNVTSIHGYKMR